MSSTIRGTHDRVATVIATQGDLLGENRVLTTMQYTVYYIQDLFYLGSEVYE